MKNLKVGDLVLTYNQKTKATEFKPIIAFTHQDLGEESH